MKKSSKEENIEELMVRIDEIIDELENGEKPLEEALESFRKAVDLYKVVKKKIDTAELKIIEITGELEDIDESD